MLQPNALCDFLFICRINFLDFNHMVNKGRNIDVTVKLIIDIHGTVFGGK